MTWIDICRVRRLLGGHCGIRTPLVYARTRVDARQEAVRRLEDPGETGKKSVGLIEGQ